MEYLLAATFQSVLIAGDSYNIAKIYYLICIKKVDNSLVVELITSRLTSFHHMTCCIIRFFSIRLFDVCFYLAYSEFTGTELSILLPGITKKNHIIGSNKTSLTMNK